MSNSSVTYMFCVTIYGKQYDYKTLTLWNWLQSGDHVVTPHQNFLKDGSIGGPQQLFYGELNRNYLYQQRSRWCLWDACSFTVWTCPAWTPNFHIRLLQWKLIQIVYADRLNWRCICWTESSVFPYSLRALLIV